MDDNPDLLISVGYSDKKLAQQSEAVLRRIKADGDKAKKIWDDALSGVAQSEKVKAHANEVDRLRKRYDPLYRATRVLEEEQKKLNRALEIGAISSDRYAKEVKDLEGAFQRGELATGRWNRSLRATGASGSRMGSQMQQVGFQVGDFATQVGAGTAASVALGQQLPQLLGAFGAFGAVAGAAAAIAIPLGSALLKLGKDAQTAEEATDALKEATDAYAQAAEAAGTPTSDLRDQYGELADEVERANEMQLALAGSAAKIARENMARSIGASIGGVASDQWVLDNESAGGLAAGMRGKITQAEQSARKLADTLGVTRDEARSLVAQIAALQDVDGPEAQVEAIVAVREALFDAAGGADEASEKIPDLMKMTQEFFDAAAKASEASTDSQISDREKLLREFEQSDRRLAELLDEMSKAERELEDARRSGDEALIELKERVVGALGEQIDKFKELRREAEAAYEAIAKSGSSAADAYEQYQSTRVAGQRWANSREGMEAAYVAARASGAGSQDEELVRAVTALSEQMGVAAKDLLAAMSFETGGKLRPDVLGPTTKWGQHFGLIQWGEPQGEKYGVTAQSSITEQVIAAGQYLADAGVKAGDNLNNIYAAILAGDAKSVHASDLAAGGVVGDVTSAVGGDQFAPHIARAEALLSAYGGVQSEVISEISEAEKAAAEAAKARADAERKSESAAKKALDARKALSEQVMHDLAQAEAEIDMTSKSAAEQAYLRVQFALTQKAKREGIDLNEKLTGTEKTYAEAIEDTARAAQRQVLLEQAKAEAQKASEIATRSAQEAAEDHARAQQQIEDQIINTIMAADDFGDALKRLAIQFAAMAAEMSLRQALFGGMGGGGPMSGVSSALGRFFGGARATGGPVSAGTPYLVNENTANSEVFVPSRSGAILNVPQAQAALRGASGSSTVTFSPSISLSGGATKEDLARVMGALRQEFDEGFMPKLRRTLPEMEARYR